MSRLASLRPSRSTLLTVLLVASFALIIPIIFQAWQAARGQQATARQALREYADFAAQKFLREAEALVYVSLTARFAAIRALDGSEAAGATGAADVARASARQVECRCGFVLPASVYFDLPLSGGIAGTSVDRALAPGAARWLADTVRAAVAADTIVNPAFRILYTRSPEPRLSVVVYTVLRGERGVPLRAVGFTSDAVAFADPVIRKVLESAALLPESLHDRPAADSALAVQLVTADGRSLVSRGRPRDTAFRGVGRFDAMFGGAAIAIDLDSSLESALYFGSSPTSHIAFFVLALAIAGVLAAVSIVLLRREQELARRRADFTSSVSHELRTPLAQILLCGETLQGGRARTADDQRWATNVIVREARRLITMVENVLHVARAERQMIALAPEWLELAPAIDEILRDFAPLAEARQVRWKIVLEAQLVALVDRFALRQVLLNLLDNAVKYGPAGQEVAVSLRLEAGSAVLAVEDEGPGIPPSERGAIWEPYRRGRGAGARNETGAGLGLAVVRELVIRHGGTVRVADASGGARIVVTFPRAFSAAPADSPEPVAAPVPALADRPG